MKPGDKPCGCVLDASPAIEELSQRPRAKNVLDAFLKEPKGQCVWIGVPEGASRNGSGFR